MCIRKNISENFYCAHVTNRKTGNILQSEHNPLDENTLIINYFLIL